jgi:hypothetical protein
MLADLQQRKMARLEPKKSLTHITRDALFAFYRDLRTFDIKLYKTMSRAV